MTYETVIGLEVHVQIATASKIFASVAAGSGAPPNTLTDPVVLALPGALPVMNKAALDAVIKTGLLFDCRINPICRWDRKNYFYPDSPKNYQISQYDQPVCLGGAVEIELPGATPAVMGEHKHIPLTRIHLEEDVGKLTHGASDSLIDFNRAGTPLMEIVTEPALRSPDEAFAFLTALRTALIAAGISDCNMEKGQMRCDANISLRPPGETKLGTKVELKNLNSISYVRAGIAKEVQRQLAVLGDGGTLGQETRLYDGESGRSASMRAKEMAHDYRYFPDPDLLPVHIDEVWQARLRAELPERPFDRQRRFLADLAVTYSASAVLIRDRALADFFEETVRAGTAPQAAANWITNDLQRELAATGLALADSKVTPAHIAELAALVEQGIVSSTQAREVFTEMFAGGETASAVVDHNGLRQSTDSGELEAWCDAALAANEGALAQIRAGNPKAINSLKGAVMKLSAGKANPRLVDEILRKRLGI